MTAAKETIGGSKIFECFLAVEKDELNLCRQDGIYGQHPRHLDKQAGTGPAIIRPDKTNRVECLGIVMRAKEELRRSFLVPETRDQVYERHHSPWGRHGKFRSCCRPTERLQLVDDINS